METPGELVSAAAEGDSGAWDALVERFTGLVWSVVRGYGLERAESADVVQTTWLRLVENLGRLREPERVGAWLATTARREALRTRQRGARQVPTEDERLEVSDPSVGPEALVVRADRDRMLWQCLESLSDRCRTLLRVLSSDPPPSYQEVSAALEMPVGSIGPTRARCLDRLRQVMDSSGLAVDGLGA